MAAYCRYCRARMTSAPEHMTHEPPCGILKLRHIVIAYGNARAKGDDDEAALSFRRLEELASQVFPLVSYNA